MSARQVVRAIPEQILASKILKMGLPELQSFVEAQVLENPALVVEESSRCPLCGAPLSGQGSCQICGSSLDSTPPSHSDDDIYELEGVSYSDDDDYDRFGSVAAETDLQSYLHRQAAGVFEGHALVIADYIIDSLDDRGYFTEPLLETARLFGISAPQLREILDEMQGFDPPGIAAVDVRECLLVQLRQMRGIPDFGKLAEKIITHCWDELSKLKWRSIATRLDVSVDEVKAAVKFISTRLTPYPSSLYRAPWQEFAPTHVPKIVPDVVIRETESGLGVEVVDFRLGALKIDDIYNAVYNQVKESGHPFTEEEKMHIREQVGKARCVLEAIELRKANLARLALLLCDEQRDFVTKGRQHLKATTQKQVATALGVHESTVSRAVSEKHVQLPSGEVIPLELFFDSALPIKEKILQIVSAAPPASPLTDGEIAARLAEQGIAIARRTVAKYRQQLQVPACQMRIGTG